MRRVGDGLRRGQLGRGDRDIAARMNALIDADGPDAIGVYYGNPSGFSSSNIIFMNGWLDAVGTRSRYFVGSVDQNAMHVVAEAMYGSMLMAPVSDVDNCDYFLLVGTNPAVSAWNWLETVPGGWRRALRPPEARRDDRRRRPVAHRNRREGRPAPGGAARPGLGAAAGVGQGDPRRGPRASPTTAPNSPPESTSCAGSSPTPISTTWRRAATSPARRSSRWRGISPPPAARWWSPAPGFRCTWRAPSPSGSATCSTSSPAGWTVRAVGDSSRATSMRSGCPAWPSRRRTGAGCSVARWSRARTRSANCPTRSPLRAPDRSGRC